MALVLTVRLEVLAPYGGGSGEPMLGALGAAQRFTIATRYDPRPGPYQGRIAGAYSGIRSSTVMSGSMP